MLKSTCIATFSQIEEQFQEGILRSLGPLSKNHCLINRYWSLVGNHVYELIRTLPVLKDWLQVSLLIRFNAGYAVEQVKGQLYAGTCDFNYQLQPFNMLEVGTFILRLSHICTQPSFPAVKKNFDVIICSAN